MILKYKIPLITLFSLVLLYVLHVSAIDDYWYLYYPYFDIPMHILGGVCLALSAFFILKDSKHIIILTIIGGISWEIFEVYFNIAGYPVSSILYKMDTAKDIANDTLGAVLVWVTLNYKK